MAEEIFRYFFRYRDERTGKVCETPFRITEAEAEELYGDRLIERIEDTREFRSVDRGQPPKD